MVPALAPSGTQAVYNYWRVTRLEGGQPVQRRYHGVHPVFLSNTQVRLLGRWHGVTRQSTLYDADSLLCEHHKTVRTLTDHHSLPQVQTAPRSSCWPECFGIPVSES
jgi:hypothetical protein